MNAIQTAIHELAINIDDKATSAKRKCAVDAINSQSSLRAIDVRVMLANVCVSIPLPPRGLLAVDFDAIAALSDAIGIPCNGIKISREGPVAVSIQFLPPRD